MKLALFIDRLRCCVHQWNSIAGDILQLQNELLLLGELISMLLKSYTRPLWTLNSYQAVTSYVHPQICQSNAIYCQFDHEYLHLSMKYP